MNLDIPHKFASIAAILAALVIGSVTYAIHFFKAYDDLVDRVAELERSRSSTTPVSDIDIEALARELAEEHTEALRGPVGQSGEPGVNGMAPTAEEVATVLIADFGETIRTISGESNASDLPADLKDLAGQVDELKMRISTLSVEELESEVTKRILEEDLDQIVAALNAHGGLKFPSPVPNPIAGLSDGGDDTSWSDEVSTDDGNAAMTLDGLAGRWVGSATCGERNYPMEISTDRIGGASVDITYTDSLNSQQTPAQLFWNRDTAKPAINLKFSTRDDRFIMLKNGDELVYRGDDLIVSPSDGRCSVNLARD